MDEKQRLLQSLEDSRAAMRRVVEKVNPQQPLIDGWTIKDVLAHIIGWEEVVLKSLRAHAAGEEWTIPDFKGIDAYNAQAVRQRETLSDEAVRREWDEVREQIRETLQALPDDRFGPKMKAPWGVYITVADAIGVLTEHEHEHAEEIERGNQT